MLKLAFIMAGGISSLTSDNVGKNITPVMVSLVEPLFFGYTSGDVHRSQHEIEGDYSSKSEGELCTALVAIKQRHDCPVHGVLVSYNSNHLEANVFQPYYELPREAVKLVALD